ncbi:neocarzinostatin apoprotein domain-containing protein [Nocardia sp. CS682]|uniref:neocarzinostatin apoprotein domain-containing protein n=1 Tax=Nocardia sp. CS682 TaxID=1047172 RepID=UPI0014316B38|nr:neocarzinostatin apoprotein domain-containing protein [Nocardia sp. CS682]
MKLIGTRPGTNGIFGRPRLVALAALTTVGLLGGVPTALAAPALQVSQSTGLAVGQTVTVTLDGLPANMAAVAVGQCKPRIAGPGDCNLTGSMMGAADGQGSWQPTGDKRAITLVGAVGGTDCTAAPGACTISVTSLTNATEIIASVPLTFGPPAETPKPTAADSDSAESDDSDSNTPVMAGIGIAAAVLIAAAVVLVARRRRN